MNSKKSMRHQGYLKDMLISKFLTKKKLDYVAPTGTADERAKLQEQLMKVQIFVASQFDAFIGQKDFTQAKLRAFESFCDKKLHEYMDKNNMTVLKTRVAAQTNLAKSMERPPLGAVATNLAARHMLSPNRSTMDMAVGAGSQSQRQGGPYRSSKTSN